MSEAIDVMRDMVGKHLAMGLKARMEAQINMVEGELRERDERISELESLVRDMFAVIDVHERHWRDDGEFTAHEHFEKRMAELGIEVGR